MQALRVASFGIRGTVGGTLMPESVTDFSAAFGTFLEGKRVLVGRDTRLSTDMFHSSVLAGLMSTGCEIIDFGQCPTPILQYSVDKYDAAGAVSISAGHIGMGWNALTFIGPAGAYMEPVGGEIILDIYHAHGFDNKPWNEIGSIELVQNFDKPYFEALAKHLDTESIRKADLTVVIDPVNGAGSRLLQGFADSIGFRLIPINAEPSGHIAHDPEPRPRNARQVASIIGHVNGDVGFVASSDMGRISLITEDGERASEEYTFALIADHVLDGDSKPVVTNCCTTKTIDDIARAHGARVVKTPVGQAHVASALADEDGAIGGEGNGSVAIPSFSNAFDGFLMIGLILEAMAQNGKKASDLLKDIPRYNLVKRKIYGDARRCYRALESFEKRTEWQDGATIDQTDGLRADWEDGWIHVRASRTEPMIRIISESKDNELAEERARTAARLLGREL